MAVRQIPSAVVLYVELDIKINGDIHVHVQNADHPTGSGRLPETIRIMDYNGDQEAVLRAAIAYLQRMTEQQIVMHSPNLLQYLSTRSKRGTRHE